MPQDQLQHASEITASLRRHGGLSYIEIPAKNPQDSAAFYKAVLGWKIDQRSADDYRFEDADLHLLGRWVVRSPSAADCGMLAYFYVNDIAKAVALAVATGGQVDKPPSLEGEITVAKVQDPAGNRIGLWQAGLESPGK